MRNYKKFPKMLFSRISFALPLALFLSLSIYAQSELSPQAQRMQEHVRYLASDELAGRGTGTAGNEKAADFIAEYFAELGLKPAGDSWLQKFPVVTDVKLGSDNKLNSVLYIVRPGMPKERGRRNARELTVGSDYIPLAISAEKSVTGELVFAGYGISAQEEIGYDDYADINAEGKIVVVLRGSPDHNDYHGPHNDAKRDPHSAFNKYMAVHTKAITAREHGAIGIAFVTPQGDSSDVLMPLELNRGVSDLGIVALHFNRKSIAKLFPPQNSLQTTEFKINDTRKPHSFDFGNAELEVTVDLEFVETPTANVWGMVAGTNPRYKNEYIVVGAHFDHLGMGGSGSLNESKAPAIHYGADDNASGTAVMMELAAAVAAQPLERPVIFMGFTGEEMGLLGSAYYCKNPAQPMENTIFMLNLDMVGRMKDKKLNIMGTGTSSGFADLVEKLGPKYELELTPNEDGFGPSDHSSFYARQIPVLFLFTGVHSDYHKPSDTWDKINYSGMELVHGVAMDILQQVAAQPEKPDYQKTKSTAGQRKSMMFSVYLGTIPDYSDHPKGMRISGVREGGPADQGGMQGGDILIRFGDQEIKNVYDYTYALQNYKPGDKVNLVVLRGDREDKEVTLEITLGSR